MFDRFGSHVVIGHVVSYNWPSDTNHLRRIVTEILCVIC